MEALDLNDGSRWASLGAYEGILRSGPQDTSMGPIPFVSLPTALVVPSASARLAAAVEEKPWPVAPVLCPFEEVMSLLWLVRMGLHLARLADLGARVHVYAARVQLWRQTTSTMTTRSRRSSPGGC